MKTEIRVDFLNRIFERMDRLEKMGIIAQTGGDLMIDADEAAAIACVKRETILIWGQNGFITRYKLGESVRFGLREFCEWVASRRQPSLEEKKKERLEKAKKPA